MRLLALATSTETSRWLRVIPIDSLGLAMAGSESVIALCICWGINILPNSPNPLCILKVSIDSHGDHDVDVVHSILTDIIPSTISYGMHCPRAMQMFKCEQRVARDLQIRRGDVYHPEFINGPIYFDILVRSTLQPSILSIETHSL